jgi:hypothetical protein
MVKTNSSYPQHTEEKPTVRAIDDWLADLYVEVQGLKVTIAKLETANKEQASIIENLKKKLESNSSSSNEKALMSSLFSKKAY